MHLVSTYNGLLVRTRAVVKFRSREIENGSPKMAIRWRRQNGKLCASQDPLACATQQDRSITWMNGIRGDADKCQDLGGAAREGGAAGLQLPIAGLGGGRIGDLNKDCDR